MMSQLTDEIANLVQHGKDLAEKVGHELSDDAQALLHTITGQLDDLHQKVADDAGEDVTEIKGDATNLRSDVQAGVTEMPPGILTPSAPPHPAQTIPSGVPVADVTGSATAPSADTGVDPDTDTDATAPTEDTAATDPAGGTDQPAATDPTTEDPAPPDNSATETAPDAEATPSTDTASAPTS
jgi:hypothetical protein